MFTFPDQLERVCDTLRSQTEILHSVAVINADTIGGGFFPVKMLE